MRARQTNSMQPINGNAIDDARELILRARGRRQPHWARELTRLDLGTRGQCSGCDKYATLHAGLCTACTDNPKARGGKEQIGRGI